MPVQPFGFNFCGGKLLAMLAFSKEIHHFYVQKYGYPLAAITTTAIHGKSIQYDRLKQLKFIGYTKGYGCSHINASSLDKCKDYIKNNYPEFNIVKKSKWQCLKFTAEKIHMDTSSLFFHGQQRGIYIGLTDSNSKEFLSKKSESLNQDKLDSAQNIASFWRTRWAKQRFSHVNSTVN